MRGIMVLGLGVIGAVYGCGSNEPATPVDAAGDMAAPERARASNGPSVEAEIGALDEKAVNEAFKKARPEITKCLRDANEGLDMPVVGGELEISLRVKGDGTLRWAFPTRSTLGHRGAAKCILSALSDGDWPKPQGGDEGLARTDYGIDPPGRAPVAWSAGDLGDAETELKTGLAVCMDEAGTSSLSVTMYIDPDGHVMTAGGAAGDENGIDAIDCAVAVAKKGSFPSPGSYPAKVTVTVP